MSLDEQASLDDVIITRELAQRPHRPPDHAAENAALVALARCCSNTPDVILDALVDTALRLCRAGTAGISMLEATSDGGEIFRWSALAGAYAAHRGGTTPRDFSPCGTCLDRNAPQLYLYPRRYFTYFAAAEPPPVVEGLVIPFYVRNRPLGTIWIVSHDERSRFDSEDLRIMTSLAEFTGAGWSIFSGFASIVENSQDAIIGESLDGTVTSWNKAAEEMLGYSAGEILGRPIALLFPPDRIAEEEQILARLRRGERVEHFETIRRRKEGNDIHVSLSISLIRNLAGEIIGASKIARDISEQKLTRARLEEVQSQLLHVSRLSTMGQMASSLAHELNQPLTAVRSYVSTLQLLAGASQLEREQIGEIATRADEQAARAGTVIRHLREFVAKGETERRLEDVNSVVEEAAHFALIEAKHKDIRIFIRLGEDLPPALIDRIQMQQVVVNLIRNALEAMEGIEPRQLTISTARLRQTEAIEIAVADTGPGIAPEIAARLFQPFVTSKRSGMGLGLSICREIVEAHGGRLSAASNAPSGSVFSVMLPLPDPEAGDGT